MIELLRVTHGTWFGFYLSKDSSIWLKKSLPWDKFYIAILCFSSSFLISSSFILVMTSFSDFGAWTMSFLLFFYGLILTSFCLLIASLVRLISELKWLLYWRQASSSTSVKVIKSLRDELNSFSMNEMH